MTGLGDGVSFLGERWNVLKSTVMHVHGSGNILTSVEWYSSMGIL